MNKLLLVLILTVLVTVDCQIDLEKALGPDSPYKVTYHDPKTMEEIEKPDLPHFNLFNMFVLYKEGYLQHSLPSTFVEGQIFNFKFGVYNGQLEEYKKKYPQQKKRYTLTVGFFDAKTRAMVQSCSANILYQFNSMLISCRVPAVGKYFISVFLGTVGTVPTKPIYEVVKKGSLFQPITSTKIPWDQQNRHFFMDVKDSDLENIVLMSWSQPGKIANITFSQEDSKVKKEFLLSNDIGVFKVPIAEFSQFKKAQTKVEVSFAYSAGRSIYKRSSEFTEPIVGHINLTQHHQSQIRDEVIIYGKIKYRVNVSEKVVIEGFAMEPIQDKVTVIDPNRQISKIDLDYRRMAKRFVFTYVPLKEGNYIIEINHIKGYAVINIPLYVGKSFPLLPDYQDSLPLLVQTSQYEKQKSEKKKTYENEDQRMKILDEINKKRLEFGAQPVKLDEKLNELAQKHSDEMAENDFSGHESLTGKNATERAKEMGLKTIVGENVGVDSSIELVIKNLERSPAHLQNTINLNWENVGIGISLGKNGAYYITQDFSTRDIEADPLSKEEIEQHKDEIQQALNEENNVKFVENKYLSILMGRYAQIDRLNEFTLKMILQSRRISNETYKKLTLPAYGKNFVETLKEKGYLTISGASRFGVALTPKGISLEVNLVYY